MNYVALGLNIFLAVLLLAALAMGWRLERKLRGMRDSQSMFIKAVKDLDTATGRAHAGLAELRAATDEAIDLLGGRIVRAKEAADRLDRSLADAEAIPARRPAAAPMPAPTAEPRGIRDDAVSPTNLRGLLELAERAQAAIAAQARPVQSRPGLAHRAVAAPIAREMAPRPRVMTLDEDLFVGGGVG